MSDLSSLGEPVFPNLDKVEPICLAASLLRALAAKHLSII
jgi:hypothetical protein